MSLAKMSSTEMDATPRKEYTSLGELLYIHTYLPLNRLSSNSKFSMGDKKFSQ